MVGLQPSNTGSGKAREALVQQDASPFNANDYDTKDPYLGHATSKDASSEPSSISSYRTGPRYQYFGLGDTQTQEGGIESNSQKENTPAFDKEPHTPPQPTSPNGAQGQSDFRAVPLLPPPSRPTSRANSNPTHRNLSSAPYNPGPLSNSARNLSPTKPTLFAPSRSSVQRDKSSSKRTTPPWFRSSSPDSFVHPAPFEDPRQAFVPPNPVLNEPLSEWFRGDTQETNAERPPVSHESSLAVMEQLSPRDEGGPSRGSVLVDATPSNSGHSQPHDRRPAEDTVPQDNAEDPHAQDTDYSLDLSQGWTPPDVPTASSSPGTQELVPTQIVPSDDVDMDLYAEPVQEPVVTQSAGSSRPSNRNPRSLLSPNKPWRAEALARFLPPPSEPRAALGIHTQDDDSLYASTQAISSPDGLPQPANFDDRTQPNISNQEATQVIAPSDGCTQVTAPTIAKPKKTAFQNAEDLFRYRQQHANFGTADATRATSISRPPTGDSDGQGRYMDVVPDSEPGRTQATPGPSRSVDDDSDEDIDNPFKSLPPLPSPVKALSSAPKIDDDDDDEDDVPLASVRHRRSRSPPRKRQRPRGSSMDEAVPFPTKHEATTKENNLCLRQPNLLLLAKEKLLGSRLLPPANPPKYRLPYRCKIMVPLQCFPVVAPILVQRH
ncbi:hypothetical protein OF83DRAFT_909232 [Amylostereum chailletii]|nr:hypothetical protein OF83DRAFT_909232 [Amylostereum chailletii]